VKLRTCIVSVFLIGLAGCAATGPREAPAPDLQLIDSAPLTLSDDCRPRGSYVVGFTVDMQGRTTDIAPPDGPSCLRAALAAWAASFRFVPPTVPTPSSLEWLLVTAPRGS
jgi:hypothetical protein